jgi:hypothetical protein
MGKRVDHELRVGRAGGRKGLERVDAAGRVASSPRALCISSWKVGGLDPPTRWTVFTDIPISR